MVVSDLGIVDSGLGSIGGILHSICPVIPQPLAQSSRIRQ